MQPTIEVDGLDEALGGLRGLGDRAGDPGAVFEAVRKSFLAAEAQRFDTEGFGDWVPDDPSTVARKSRRGQDVRTMRATGALHRSLTTTDAPGAVFRPSRDSVELGTSEFEGRWAQYGSGNRRRRVVVVTDGMRGAWADLLRAHVMGETHG